MVRTVENHFLAELGLNSYQENFFINFFFLFGHAVHDQEQNHHLLYQKLRVSNTGSPSGNFQKFLHWISELLWASDSSVPPISPLLNRIACSYSYHVPTLYVAGNNLPILFGDLKIERYCVQGAYLRNYIQESHLYLALIQMMGFQTLTRCFLGHEMCRNLGRGCGFGGRAKGRLQSPVSKMPAMLGGTLPENAWSLLQLPLVGLIVPLTDTVIQKDHFFASKRHR